MKSLTDMVKNIQANGIPPSGDNGHSVSDGAKDFIDKLFLELKATYPAWSAAMKNDDDINNAKRVWLKAFVENGITKVNQVKIGLVEARKDARPFFPSVGEFIEWCKGKIDADAAFDRMIRQEPSLDEVERRTRGDCAFACRTQLPEGKARELFKKVYIRWYEINEAGQMPDPDIKALPKNSATKPTDHMVEERIRSGKKTPLEIRLEAIRIKK